LAVGECPWADACGDGVVAAVWAVRFGDGTSDVLKVPYFSSVRWRTMVASSGISTFHFRASTLMIPSVRRAHGQSSAISSSCRTPWVMSRLAVFSGRLSMWIVQAEWTMYTAMLQICLRLYVFL
jgi:hypothetical protein